MKGLLIDIAMMAGVTVVTMAIVNRTPLKAYVGGEAKILGVL